ncbi:hypothetical protein IQ06DRAFT_348337 [Phaeosphaeriaceae sp. SRC1lsM3a]|nr:hypothetical protein IQ06DRAFT_348337 [Stagonospora sp. SRC1lsM3a]
MTESTAPTAQSNMTGPPLLVLLPGYESDEAEVEHSPAVQDVKLEVQARETFTVLLASPPVVLPASPKPAKDTTTLTASELLPDYSSDEGEVHELPKNFIPKIVIKPADSSPPSSLATNTPSRSSNPAPNSAPVPVTIRAATLPAKSEPRRSQRIIKPEIVKAKEPGDTGAAVCVDKLDATKERTAKSKSSQGSVAKDSKKSLTQLTNMITRQLESSFEVAEAFGDFVRQHHPMSDASERFEQAIEESYETHGRKRNAEGEGRAKTKKRRRKSASVKEWLETVG